MHVTPGGCPRIVIMRIWQERSNLHCTDPVVLHLSPLFMLKVLKLHLFYPLMLVTLCFNDLFSYKLPMHRKRVRFKCV